MGQKVADARTELVKYGKKMVASGLVAGAGGNISIRSDKYVFLSPSGYALDEIKAGEYVKVELATGKVLGKLRPTSETSMHLACYRARSDIAAIVHTHSPWAGGVISGGGNIEPMFPEFVADLDKVVKIEYILPTTEILAERVGEVIKGCNAVLMENHGVVTIGRNLREAYYRSIIIEDAAKSLVVAKVIGSPRFLNEKEVNEIKNLDAVRHRRDIAGRNG
jgi:L-fuculose-phosphate aldolase